MRTREALQNISIDAMTDEEADMMFDEYTDYKLVNNGNLEDLKLEIETKVYPAIVKFFEEQATKDAPDER